MGASSPEEAARGAWSDLLRGDRASFMEHLAPGESSRLIEACALFRDRLASMAPEEKSTLFSYLLLEASPDEVETWQPMDVLELLTGTPTSRRIAGELDVEFLAARARRDSCSITVALPQDSFTLQAVNPGGGWLLIGTDRLLNQVLQALPPPWPEMP